MSASALYDVPGPRAKLRHALYSVLGGLGVFALLSYFFWRLWDAEQITSEKWEFLENADIVEDLAEGLRVTLSLAATSIVLAIAFGAVFAAGRLSDHRYVRLPSTVVIEFFRAVPVLLMILFLNFTYADLLGDYWSIVIALMLYNGAVLAEVFRAGILAISRGQTEAAQAIGLRKNQVLRLILAPQAVASMLPAIISQCVVALKDTTLGFAIGSSDITDRAQRIYVSPFFNNPIAVALTLVAVFVAINYTLSLIARWLEGRTRRRGKRTVHVDAGGAVTD